MRRNCCHAGYVHLNCIKNEDLQKCHDCGKDPMEGVPFKEPRHWLRPLPSADRATMPPRPRSDDFSFRWKMLVGRAMDDLMRQWCDRVVVSELKIGATLVDGLRCEASLSMPGHASKSAYHTQNILKTLVVEHCAKWADNSTGSSLELENIAEFTVSFTCTHAYLGQEALRDEARPFATKKKLQHLGTWYCVLYMSALAESCAAGRVRAKRIIVKNIN